MGCHGQQCAQARGDVGGGAAEKIGENQRSCRHRLHGRFGKLPGYTIGNVMASYAFNDQFTLRLNVNNVTNREYATSGNWAMTRAFTGPERAYVVSGDFRFW